MLQKPKINCKECVNTNCLIKMCKTNKISLTNLVKDQLNYRKNQYIFFQGSPVNGTYFIQNGKVKVISTNESGKEHIVRFGANGHKLSYAEFKCETYPNGAVALENSCICFFDNKTLKKLFLANPEFTYQVMVHYSKELLKIENRIKSFTQMTTEEKIIDALLYIIEVFGLSNEEKELNVTLSRLEIANIVGTNAEQVSRTITNLKQKKIIKTYGKKIFVKDYDGMKNKIVNYSNTSF